MIRICIYIFSGGEQQILPTVVESVQHNYSFQSVKNFVINDGQTNCLLYVLICFLHYQTFYLDVVHDWKSSWNTVASSLGCL